MSMLSFEKILKIVEIICKVLLAALGSLGIVDTLKDDDEQN